MVVGADGLAYQHLGSIVISNPGGSVDATTRVMVIDPTNATSIVHTLQGKGVGGVVVGADGTAYASTNTGVSAISPAGVVTTYEVPARGIVNGDVVVGADGLAYQHLGSIVISNPGGSVDATTRVMVIDPDQCHLDCAYVAGQGCWWCGRRG